MATATKSSVSASIKGLEAEPVADDPQPLGRGDEVVERAVEVGERVGQRLGQGPAPVEPVAEVDADDLGVVVGVERTPCLLVAAAELVVVGDVAVVDRGEVGDAVGPERLRVAQVDPALGRHPGVADRQRPAPGRDAVGRLEARRASRPA